jgi:hypothetical protein
MGKADLLKACVEKNQKKKFITSKVCVTYEYSLSNVYVRMRT